MEFLFLLNLIFSFFACGIARQNRSSFLLFLFWHSLLFFSLFDVSKFGDLNIETKIVFLIAIFSSSVGVLFSAVRISSSSDRNNYKLYLDNKNLSIIFVMVNICIFVIIVFLSRFIYLNYVYGIGYLRNPFVGSGYNDKIVEIFFNKELLLLYNIVVPTFLTAMLFLSSKFSSENEVKIFILAAIGLILTDIIFMSRINAYMLIFLLVISVVDRLIQIRNLKTLFLILIAFSLVLFTTFLRSIDFGILDMLKIYFLHYHTIGVYMFDNFISSQGEPIANSPLPVTFSYVSFPFEYVYSKFINVDYVPVIYSFGLWNAEFKPFFDDQGTVYYYNAFVTNLFPLYYDFNIYGVVIGSLFYGFFLGKSNSIKNLSQSSIYSGLFLIYGYLGFFNPMYVTLHANMVGVIIILFLFVHFLYRNKI